MLGTITQYLCPLGLWSPRPEIPFLGHSILDVTTKVRGIPDPVWSEYRYSTSGIRHPCTISGHLAPLVDSITENLPRLDLHEFVAWPDIAIGEGHAD